jgi:DNA-binding transcriptional regulator YiaG
MPLNDDVARLTSATVRLLVHSGELKQMRQFTISHRGEIGLPVSLIAKACGVSAATVQSWESGFSEPTTAQALAWLDVITKHLPRSPVMGFAPAGTPHAPAWVNGHAEPADAS